MKRSVIIVLAVLIAATTAAAVASVVQAKADRVIEREFKVESGKTLEIELDTGGDVIIEGWGKKKVAVTARIGGRNADDVEIEFDEGSSGVMVTTEYGSRRSRRSSDVILKIKVPDTFDVSIDTKGGDVAISGVKGKFDGKTYGGDIDFSALKGEVHFTTMGGDIEIRESEVDGRVKTMGGDVTIRDVVGDIKGSTMGGDVTYDNVKGSSAGKKEKRVDADKEVSITTMGGDINVDYPDKKVKLKTFGGDIEVGKAREVDVTTMGGDIEVDEAPIGAQVSTMGGDITVGQAGSYVRAKTMGGDIEVGAIDGWIKATTMGGDIKVRMVGDPKKGKRDVELESMGGDIEIEVPAGLSMEFDIELAYTKNSKQNFRIESDFDMKIEKTDKWESKWGSKRKYIYGTGTVGGGEHTVRIKTVNGNITIRKGT